MDMVSKYPLVTQNRKNVEPDPNYRGPRPRPSRPSRPRAPNEFPLRRLISPRLARSLGRSLVPNVGSFIGDFAESEVIRGMNEGIAALQRVPNSTYYSLVTDGACGKAWMPMPWRSNGIVSCANATEAIGSTGFANILSAGPNPRKIWEEPAPLLPGFKYANEGQLWIRNILPPNAALAMNNQIKVPSPMVVPYSTPFVWPLAVPMPVPRPLRWQRPRRNEEPSKPRERPRPRGRPREEPITPIPYFGVPLFFIGTGPGQIQAPGTIVRPLPNGGVDMVPAPPTPVNRPPRAIPVKGWGKATEKPKHEKKIQRKNMKLIGAIWGGIGTFTEVMDFIVAMHKSKSSGQLSIKASKRQVLDYMMTTPSAWANIDFAEGYENYINMQIGDFVAALGSDQIKQLNQVSGSTTGLDRALRSHGDMISEQGEGMQGFAPTVDINGETGEITVSGPGFSQTFKGGFSKVFRYRPNIRK